MSKESSAAVEPCSKCGEDTAAGSVFYAAGSVFYSDRRQVELPDGSQTHVCSQCVAALRMAKGGAPLTDVELRRMVDHSFVASFRWGPGR